MCLPVQMCRLVRLITFTATLMPSLYVVYVMPSYKLNTHTRMHMHTHAHIIMIIHALHRPAHTCTNAHGHTHMIMYIHACLHMWQDIYAAQLSSYFPCINTKICNNINNINMINTLNMLKEGMCYFICVLNFNLHLTC